MPIYAYRCSACGHQEAHLQKLAEAPLRKCPACGRKKYAKQLTAAGFQLKGSAIRRQPIRLALLWMAFWGFWTALIRPIVGMPIWDFVERWANWGAPLALLFMRGWPKDIRSWFR